MSNPILARTPMADDPQPSADTKLARASTPQPGAGVLKTPEEYKSAVTRWAAERYHVLSPVANFSGMPQHFGLVPAMVVINPDPRGGEVYSDPLFCQGDEVALAKPALSKIAQAAGLSIATERTDPRTIADYWEVRATATWIGLDGTPQSLTNTVEYDLRQGSARTRGSKGAWSEAQRLKACAHGLRGCEARAINAVIRQYGLRQKYKPAELDKPFVCVRVVHMPDLSNPAIAMQAHALAQQGTARLGFQVLPPTGHLPAPEPLGHIGVGDPAAPLAPAVPAPRRIEHVEQDIEAGVYNVRLDGGDHVTTSAHDVARHLMRAQKDGAGVRLEIDAAGMIKAVDIVQERKL